MLKCLNVDCTNCKDNECKILCENSECASRIIPRHTPNYAEEQLQHAIENELEVIKLRNKELVSENEKLQEENINIANEKDDFSQQMRILMVDNKKLKEDLEFERNMYSGLKDKCKSLEIELQKEILKSKKIIKDLVSYL